MGGAPIRPALPNDGGAGLVAGGTRPAHRLHRARGRIRRTGRVAVPVWLRAGSADEPAARRTALLACDAKRRRDGDAGSIGLAQEGLRLALLVASRPHPVVPGTEFVCAAMVAGRVADALRPRRPSRQKQAHVSTELRRCGDRGENGRRARVAREERRAVRPSINCEADVAGMATTLQGSGFRVVFGPKSPRRWKLPKVVTQAAAALEGGASND